VDFLIASFNGYQTGDVRHATEGFNSPVLEYQQLASAASQHRGLTTLVSGAVVEENVAGNFSRIHASAGVFNITDFALSA
jgi:hypothetical protein